MLKNKKKGIHLVIAAFVVLSLTISGIIVYNANINSELQANTGGIIAEVTQSMQFGFDNGIKTEIQMLESMADMIVDLSNEVDINIEFINNLIEYYPFKELSIYGTGGGGISSSGLSLTLTDGGIYDDVLKGEIVVTEPTMSITYEVPTISIMVPIYEGENVVGVMEASYLVEYLSTLLPDTFSGQGNSYVINQDGAIIASTEENFSFATSSLFDAFKLATFEDGRTSEEVIASIKAGESGSLSYSSGSLDRMAQYIPLSVNGWTIVTIISTDIISASANTIVRNMTILNIVIISCIALMLTFMVFQRNDSVKNMTQLAYYDDLTELPNLRLFKDLVQKNINLNSNERYGVVKLDIVNFKAVNEIHGFKAGNAVITRMADFFDDIPKDEIILARVGSDEFMVFGKLSFIVSLTDNHAVYENKFMDKVNFIGRHTIGFRYGRYYIEQEDKDINAIIDRVVMAHSLSRRQSAFAIYDYDDVLRRRIVRNTELTNKMRDALKHERFLVYLQPKYRIRDDKLIGAEALVRWRDIDGTLISPGEFIPLFEQNGFITRLDRYILEGACKIVKGWADDGHEPVPISVNFSRAHLAKPYFVEQLNNITERYNISKGYIEIELTETTMLYNEDALQKILEKLHEDGFKLSMDDFGSGYSSLGLLKNLEVDTIKMDRSFFVNSKNVDRGNLVVESVIDMAHKLDIATIAEGVETAEQVEFLRSLGCEMVQGYFYGRPIPSEDFAKTFMKTEEKKTEE